VTAPTPRLTCATCDGSGILTVPDTDGESASTQACPDPVHEDQWGGHEFGYESHTDLFRCVFCQKYEVVARDLETGIIALCTGEPPAGAGPIEVNAW
jgi:hypothetical protein